MENQVSIKSKRSKYKYLIVILSITNLIFTTAAIINLSSPNYTTQLLFSNWHQPAIIEIVSNTSINCIYPNFLLFSYYFRGMTLGCNCQNNITHSGYCYLNQINNGCSEISAIDDSLLINFVKGSLFCAKVSPIKLCDNCPTGYCSINSDDNCPIVKIVISSNLNSSYQAIDFIGNETLYISRSDGNTPIVQVSTDKGDGICKNSKLQYLQGFQDTIYNEVLIHTSECKDSKDPRYISFSEISDSEFYQLNNMSIIPQNNYFTTFYRNLIEVSNSSKKNLETFVSIDYTFLGNCLALEITTIIVLSVEILILLKFGKYSFLLFIIYTVVIIVNVITYQKINNFQSLALNLQLIDSQSQKDMNVLLKEVSITQYLLITNIVIVSLIVLFEFIRISLFIYYTCFTKQKDDQP